MLLQRSHRRIQASKRHLLHPHQPQCDNERREETPIVAKQGTSVYPAIILTTDQRGYMDTAGNAGNSSDNIFRHFIAWTLLALSVLGLVALAIVVVWNASADKKYEASTLVFNALLPLFGTWVGTLLAFYFSKENLDSATRNINELTRVVSGMDRLKSVLALDKAIPLSAIFIPKDGSGVALENLQAIIAAMKVAGRQRLLVFKSGNVIERIIHLIALESFVSDCALNPQPNAKALNQLTLVDLFAVPTIDQYSRQSFAVVAQSATLAEVKAAMDQQTRQLGALGSCEDVFITQSGSPVFPVLGWITNDIIIENAKV
jgi:hypothetical protein